ncbi:MULTISPECIES: DUF2391 family protein [unclassified Haladaptatus]|uniref:DUF2391 family protein n=1 Tax=unclassified Haladaptatus TaxID=2622732 RepID=UPI0023E78E8B|nr:MULTISPECIES: DUF2391 family protein [unclassified Haladaptatus]
MAQGVGTVLRRQIRGVVGALIVSVELLFTTEMWVQGSHLPTAWLLVYAVVGLAVVIAIRESIGSRKGDETPLTVATVVTDFTELLLQSFLTAYAVLLLFGIIELSDPPVLIARLGLFFVVPLGFGAALADELLYEAETEPSPDRPFYRHLGVFAVGALFVGLTLAPTDEMALMAAHANWTRLALVLVLSLVVAYLVLYELEFRGQRTRSFEKTLADQVGHAFVSYTVGVVVAVALLAAFGQFRAAPLAVWVQLAIVLGFPATIGASGARVVLG